MYRTASASGRLLLALLASIVTGLVLAAVALPVVGGVGLAAKSASDDFLVLPAELVTEPPPVRSSMIAADGTELAQLYKENRVPVSFTAIPEVMRKATIAIEDARFYQHSGVDYKGTLRAGVENVRSSAVSQGGSTLTQQYVKNALLQAAGGDKTARQAARAPTIQRKLKEARYAIALEQRLSKDEILRRYLNIAYFGNGAYGVGAAATYYFGVPVQRLSLAQSATLAGMLQNQRKFDPVKALKDPKYMTYLLDRRNLVLRRMRDEGMITEQERAVASAERSQPGKPLFTIKPVKSGCENVAVRAPYFCDYVRYALERTDLGEELGDTLEQRQNTLLGAGVRIRTTLDMTAQLSAQRAVEETVPPADKFGAGAVANIVEPGTGHIKAMAVNRRYTESKKPGNTKVNLAIGGSSGFQGGSTFKAFVLAAAIKQGIPLSLTLDAPQTYTSPVFTDYKDGRKVPYTVSNAGDSESGTFDMVQATHDSVNTYFIQLEERVGVESAASLAESMGVRRFDETGRPRGKLVRGGSFVLGTSEVSPLAMAGAYATFAAHGLYCPPSPVLDITFPGGRTLDLSKPACKQVLEPNVADTVTSVLTGVIDGYTPGRTGRAASIGRPAAGKTGTTNGSKAAWFIGYTPQLATAVWVGYPGGPGDPVKEMRNVVINNRYYRQVYGGTIPAPIWRRTMSGALADVPVEGFTSADSTTAEGRRVAVPDVRGLSISAARRQLVQAGFSVRDGGRVSRAGTPNGTAAYTSPSAGRERSLGSRVTLFESNGRRRGSAPPAAPDQSPATPPAAQPAASPSG